MAFTRNILYYGSDVPPPEPIKLRAGPLSLTFVAGEIRDIRLGSWEVLRRIYVTVRDRNWRRVPATLHEVRETIGPESFDVKFAVDNKQAEIDFHWNGSIIGKADGTISFSMEGSARSTFWRNRIGFCVLHSSALLAGTPCSVESVDGTCMVGEFPKFISPHQVFSRIRAISHEVFTGTEAEIRFEGDVYEMEDQRNWSDASYKTYCPPLNLPFPAEISAGTSVSQAVTIAVKGGIPTLSPEPNDEIVVLRLTDDRNNVPRIGLVLAPNEAPLSSQSIERLRALRLTHLRVDLRLNDDGYDSLLQRATNEASRLGSALEVALFLTDEAELEIEALRAVLNRVHPPVHTWLVFHVSEKSTAPKWLNMVRAGLSDYNHEALFGCGTDANFAELNRCRPAALGIDLVCYPLNPQVHAFDQSNLIENLQALAPMVESARQFAGDARLSVSPVTLRPRSKPQAARIEHLSDGAELPASVDPRQVSLFGAAWTAGALKSLLEAGISSATFYQTHGWEGVMNATPLSRWPQSVPSISRSVFPLYHVFADVGEFQGGEAVACTSTGPLKAQALALTKGDRMRIMLANMTPERQTIRLCVPAASNRFEVKVLDEITAEWAMTDPEAFRSASGEFLTVDERSAEIEMSPLALMRLDRI